MDGFPAQSGAIRRAVREATHDDIPRVIELGAAFHAYCPYRDIPLDRDAFGEFAHRLIDGGVILLSDDGMIGGAMVPLYFNPAVVMGVELFWWAGRTGSSLREAFEAWARDQGAQGVQFTGLADEREATIRKVYSRAGFSAVEVGFIKRF